MKQTYFVNSKERNLTMNQYYYEMHCHGKEVSICSRVTTQQLIEDHIEAGYTGVTITNHLNRATFSQQYFSSWKQQIEHYLSGYYLAKKLAKDRIDVFLGMEITFDENLNDYLVYGFEPEFLFENGDLMKMGLKAFSKLIDHENILIFQAHPFRDNMTITNPKYLDGIEVYNANPRHTSRNEISKLWAEQYHLLTVGGSDYHKYDDLGHGGICLNEKVESIHDIVKHLKNQTAQIITEKLEW